jgi:hypothetical protein
MNNSIYIQLMGIKIPLSLAEEVSIALPFLITQARINLSQEVTPRPEQGAILCTFFGTCFGLVWALPYR